MSVFKELERRGLIAQATNAEKIEEKLNEGPVTFYIGFDATADSLHVGHFLQLVVMRHLQQAGHRPIVLLGTGTTMIGDPTGKTDMRKMLTVEDIDHNAECFRRQISRFIDFSEGKAIMVRNGDWLRNLNYIDLLRDVGVHFSVNRMLTFECFKSRMERGLSFLEFNYMIMQSYDFLHLFREHHCTMQLGGNDQWSNIIGGVELVRRIEQEEVFGMTFTLLTTSEGKKMGKTEKGALWLDPEKTSPYEFFQYWRNVDDADVIRCLKMLTFLPIEEIEAMEQWEGSQLNEAKELLAHELTSMVHGKEEADKALAAAKALFTADGDAANIPETVLSAEDLNEAGEVTVVDALVLSALCPSKSEARRAIQQGGVSVGNDKVTDIAAVLTKEQLAASVILKRGKKSFKKITLK